MADKHKKNKNKKEDNGKSDTKKKSSPAKKERANDPRARYVIGVVLFCIALFLSCAFVSNILNHYGVTGTNARNITGKAGDFLADMFIKESFGIGAFYFIYLLIAIGVAFVAKVRPKIWRMWKLAIISLLWLPLLFATLKIETLGGYIGYSIYSFLKDNIALVGVIITLVVTALIFLIIEFQLNLEFIGSWNEKYNAWLEQRKEKREQERLRKLEEKNQKQDVDVNDNPNDDVDEPGIYVEDDDDTNKIENEDDLGITVIKAPDTNNDNGTDLNGNNDLDDDDLGIKVISRPQNDTDGTKCPETNTVETNKVDNDPEPKPVDNKRVEFFTINTNADENQQNNDKDETEPTDSNAIILPPVVTTQPNHAEEPPKPASDNGVEIVVNKTTEEKTVDEAIEHHTIDTPYDPHYELRDFIMPPLDLLNDVSNSTPEINPEELEENKNRIVETLGNYGIAIDKIMATIGPTVTLYEIVPAPGVRISKIKNLEDDIALSLAALGIRIIAPIPGKGTIGIEVPNKDPQTVSMRSVLSSEKFQKSKYALPCAIGKTITNATYVFDLAKMPHILMAGATGQGKSVGLNAIVASLLYSKHPSELKFVMVDPKKVELTLYKRIERHYLAKLPDATDAIITDTKKVVRTLNSLCVEMDTRYDLLKAAECRNIIEYNEKFKARKLLPTEGHRFLPYIVLVVDEFADLIMTAGRDVEAPIARLAQLARAIGIHLIIATQRPSVNIITGTIKANFPARIAFRVISVVDSKTILDQTGANQLIGRGDMLLSTGNDLVRLQCAFIDTPEVEEITKFIGEQHGYPEAFLLPEVPEEGNGENGPANFDDDGGGYDSLFEDAARIVVQTQQGSTSMIQRKLKLGYNRAGRIIDQLEAAGIVGPFSGSKSREVKVADEFALEQILRDLGIIV